MNHPLSLTLAFCTFGALTSVATSQTNPPKQLLEGHYLVGTQGWTTASKPDPTKATIQLISTYTGKAIVLNVKGIPTGENPASFLQENTRSFLVGTKTASAPAAGNVYRVQIQQDMSWKAFKLNTTAIGFNVSAMVSDGAYAYLMGSAIFGRTGDDAQIKKMALANGVVTNHSQFGNKYTKGKPKGAMGIGSELVIVGKTLHAFTFDSTTLTPMQNEHWTISTTTPVKVKQLPSLPMSRRWAKHGFGTRGAHLDVRSGNLVIIGLAGEMIWRDQNGKDLSWKGYTGTGLTMDKAWRGTCFNMDTYAVAMGDHADAGIDEHRGTKTSLFDPLADNVAKAVRPSKGTFVISGMTYIQSSGDYRPFGEGCIDGANGAPWSYASGAPIRGNKGFGLTLHTNSKTVSNATVAVLILGSKSTKIDLTRYAPGCILQIDPFGAFVMAVVKSSGKDFLIPAPLPSGQKLNVYTQWYVVAPKANSLMAVLSDARRLTTF